MLISVIMLTYNAEMYIEKALDSVLMQECSYPIEILIGDDASTDKTVEKIGAYLQKHPDVIRLIQQPRNVGATRNAHTVLSAARGQYLATLEGDDFWTNPRKLQMQVDFLENNPQFIGTCHRFATVDNDGIPIHRKLHWIKHKLIFTMDDFEGIYLPSQPSTFVRRNIFLDESQDLSFLYRIDRMIGDRTLMLLFLSKGDFYCFDEVMSAYRISSRSSITQALYERSDNAIERDVELTKRLERFTREELNIHVDFSKYKKEQYASALIRCIKAANKENIALLRRIREADSLFLYAAYAVASISKRMIKRLAFNDEVTDL